VYLPSLDFIVAFLACFRAGLVPVPVYPPDPRRSRAYISAFSQIAEDCSAKAALSHADYLRAVSLAGLAETAKKLFSFGRSSKGGPGKADWPELTWINTTELLASASGSTPAGAAAAPVPTPAPGDAAFLQYTSGSTADPKGVIVTHACLQHNLTAIMAALEADQSTVVVSWLPQYHDMGLIGALPGHSSRCSSVRGRGREFRSKRGGIARTPRTVQRGQPFGFFNPVAAKRQLASPLQIRCPVLPAPFTLTRLLSLWCPLQAPSSARSFAAAAAC
jgi:acyl-CoA synthetase (AMP-forming)/AMP-acid ligase II